MRKQDLRNELREVLKNVRETVEIWETLPLEQLTRKPNAYSWSALECLDHLNQYADFYLPEMRRRITEAPRDAHPQFFPGRLGDYFARSMKVTNQQVKKMKAPKDKRPVNGQVSNQALQRFLSDVDTLSVLLDQAQSVNWTKTKTAISLTPWIKLRLGDTFRFYVYHIDRHVWQGQRALDGR